MRSINVKIYNWTWKSESLNVKAKKIEKLKKEKEEF